MSSCEYSECSLEPCGPQLHRILWHPVASAVDCTHCIAHVCRCLQLCLNTLARELPFLVGRVYTDHFVRDSDLQVSALSAE